MKKLLLVSSIAFIVTGALFVVGGGAGIVFTYRSVAQENITTPEDATLPRAPVRGPLTLKAQADIIRTHSLRMTGGKTFAEMPRQIQKLDESGNPVMTANSSRDIWITATTLTTALNLGMLAYAFSGLALIAGIMFILIGIVFCALRRGTPGV